MKIVNAVKNNSEIVISLIGLIISIFSVLIARLAYKFSVDQSEPRGKLFVSFNWKSSDTSDKNTYINVIIYNTGLRELHFAWPCVALRYLIKEPRTILYIKSSFNTHQHEFTLKGGQSKSILLENDFKEKEYKNINYFFIQDQIGNTYKFQVAGLWQRLHANIVNASAKFLTKFKREKSNNTR